MNIIYGNLMNYQSYSASFTRVNQFQFDQYLSSYLLF